MLLTFLLNTVDNIPQSRTKLMRIELDYQLKKIAYQRFLIFPDKIIASSIFW